MKMNSEKIVMRLKIFDSEKKINLEFPRKDAEHSKKFTLYMHVAPALRIRTPMKSYPQACADADVKRSTLSTRLREHSKLASEDASS